MRNIRPNVCLPILPEEQILSANSYKKGVIPDNYI